jgi:phospholipid-transporting ATPase
LDGLFGFLYWLDQLLHQNNGMFTGCMNSNLLTLLLVSFLNFFHFKVCVTFFVLFNNFIPISLYVTMELTKVWQAVVWINSDVKMFHDDGYEGKPARVKTASLVEELGQVEYVFSDKTGTLTQNKMEFLKFTVNGKGYGKGTTEIGRAAAVRRGEVLEDDRPKDWKPEADGFQFYDPSVSKLAYRKDKNAIEIENFWKFLAICHTVIPEPDKKNPGGIFYNASSPDEGALVKCAKYMGYEFNKRTHDTISYVDPDGKEHSVKILNILEFNSTRKRMSIIFRDEDGTIKVYCKGADSVIWKLMSKDVQHEKATNDLLDKFGGEGLRTLLCAERVLEEKVWKDWNENHWQPAITDLSENKKDKVAEAAGMMEVDLQLVGSTAIEDKLQDGVPATISTLQRAGIKVWVLTGDKQETAINIGYACAMLDNDMYKVIFNEKNKKTLRQKVLQETANLKSKMKTEKGTDFGVIVDGDTLSIILNWDKDLKSVDVENGEALRISFLKLCMMCKSVICCRVSPLQKAQVVQLVKNNLGDVITLAIGDGANDVSMIQGRVFTQINNSFKRHTLELVLVEKKENKHLDLQILQLPNLDFFKDSYWFMVVMHIVELQNLFFTSFTKMLLSNSLNSFTSSLMDSVEQVSLTILFYHCTMSFGLVYQFWDYLSLIKMYPQKSLKNSLNYTF